MEELRLRSMENNQNFGFLSQKDRYIFRKPKALLNIGIIGTGTIGLEHIRVTALEERARVSALYDTDLEVLQYAAEYTFKNFGYTPQSCETLATFLNQELDAYIICTPNYQHLSTFNQIRHTGKPIYIEKPMAHTLAESCELYRLIQEHQSPVHIGLQYRYKPQYLELLRELRAADIGHPKHIQITEHRPPFLDKVNQWNKYNRFSGGTLIEKCCHYFNLMQLIAKAIPTKVSCQASQSHNFASFNEQTPADAIDSAQVMVEFENGLLASLSLCMFAPSFYEEVTVCTSKAKLKAQEEFNPILNTDLGCSLEILHAEAQISKKSNTSYGALIAASGHCGSTYKAHEIFIDSVFASQQCQGSTLPDRQEIEEVSPKQARASLEEAVWSIAIGQAAQVSAKEGKIISMREMLQDFDTAFLYA